MKQLLHVSLLAFVLLCFTTSSAQQIAKAKTKDGVTKVKGPGGEKEKSKAKESMNMRGAYSMYYQVANDGTKDSLMGNEQLKLFTDKYVMYAHKRPKDSLGEFGVGTYQIQNGKVIEHMFYTAASGARLDTFELEINKTGEGYRQVIDFPELEGRRFKLTEDYTTVGKHVNTPIDGAWKQTRNVSISPKGDTAYKNDNPTQYKVFQSGHFMWGNTVLDSATQKPVSYFGYGTFSMKGNQITEVNTNSSFVTSLVEIPVNLDIKFTGKDRYQQTIIWPDGWKQIEYYERLK